MLAMERVGKKKAKGNGKWENVRLLRVSLS